MKIGSPRLKALLYRIGLGLGLALFVYQVWLAVLALRSSPAPLIMATLRPCSVWTWQPTSC